MDKARAMGIQHYLLKSSTLKELQATIFSLHKKEQDLLTNGSNNETNAASPF
jgi:hypothetical protein